MALIPRRALAHASLAAMLWIATDASLGAAPPDAAAGADGVLVADEAHPPKTVAAAEILELPAVSVSITYETEHGTRQAAFEGPLLWTVLEHAGAIDPAKPRDQVRRTVVLTGRDGYTAVLALGEIAPEFEGKQVIVAKRMDGKPLDPDHFRIVVPGDRRGGRSVRDLVRISVAGPAPAEH